MVFRVSVFGMSFAFVYKWAYEFVMLIQLAFSATPATCSLEFVSVEFYKVTDYRPLEVPQMC